MAIMDFPASPLDGDTHNHAGRIYRYNATKTVWELLSNENNIAGKIATEKKAIAFSIALS